MKTLRIFFLLALTVGLLFSCSKTDYDEGISGIDLKAKKVTPQVFVVTPSGGDDTPAICQALVEATDAGPGSVVQLLAGEYSLGLMEIRDFCGVFKGAGKGQTIINVMNDLDVLSLWNMGQGGDLVKFVGGDVHLSDFTIRTPEGRLSVTGPANGIIRSLINFSACNAQYENGNTNRSINVVIDNVSFKGQLLEGGVGYNKGYNCYFPLRAGWDQPWGTDIPREKIDFKITNSEFDTFCYGLVLEGMNNGKIIVGEMNKGNIFSNLDQAGGVWESRNMEVSIEGNTFNVPEFSWGFDLDDFWYYTGILKDEPQTKSMIFNVQNNVFNLAHSEYGFMVRNLRRRDYPDEPATLYQVRNNQFNMTGGYPWAVYGVRTKGMVIRNNKFNGYGDMALVLTTSENGLILGNNFSTAEFSSAAVYLTSTTKDCTVVGGSIADQVIDMGTNNIITGFNVNNTEAPFGQSIVDNLKTMKEAMHELKGHY